MSEEIYDPRERLEIFLNAVRTGDVEGLPDPQTREEMYLAAIAGKSALPDTADASIGDALVLDADKKPVWDSIPAPTIPKKYVHNIWLEKSSSSIVTTVAFTIINSDSTPFDNIETVRSYLRSLTTSAPLVASGRRFDESGTNPTFYAIYGIFAASSASSFYFKCDGIQVVDGKLDDFAYGVSFSFSGGTISDTVYEF